MITQAYKVLTPALRSVGDSFPNFPKELVVQYSTKNWVCGMENSKLFVFKDLPTAQIFVDKISKKHNTQYDIWTCDVVGMKPKSRYIRVRPSTRSLFIYYFTKLWNNTIGSSSKRILGTKGKAMGYFVAEKVILKERV